MSLSEITRLVIEGAKKTGSYYATYPTKKEGQMTRDEINRLIQDNGLFHGTVSIGVIMDMNHLERLVALVAAAEREKIAAWMIQRGYATGHGDTIEDLLKELEWQIAEQEREACAKLCDVVIPGDEYSTALINSYADNIRARGNT